MICGLFVVFVAYPFSTGPVCWLYFDVVQHDQSSQFGEAILKTVYRPLSMAIDSCQPLQDFFWWYLFDLWEIDLGALECYSPQG